MNSDHISDLVGVSIYQIMNAHFVYLQLLKGNLVSNTLI